MPKCE